MAREHDNDLHSQILTMLLDKVREDPFPSVTMLDLIEGNMRDDEVEEYAGILLEKVRGDQFPSLDHLHRLIELA
jgi:hypothetical protein